MRSREKLQTLEPFVPVYNFITAGIMLINGQGKAAIPILEALPADAAALYAISLPRPMRRKGGMGKRRIRFLPSRDQSA